MFRCDTRHSLSEDGRSQYGFTLVELLVVLAMFLLWASRPRSAEPDETGAYFIGDVGEAPEQPTFESRAEPVLTISASGIRREYDT